MMNATATAPHSWDVTTVTTAVPDDAEAVDTLFADLQTEARSSGWFCTVTIECGTVVCACQ